MAVRKGLSRVQSDEPSVSLSKTGAAHAAEGSIANTGFLTITTGPPVRSRYQEQTVTRIAPPEGLQDRDDELALLAQFCTEPDPHDAFVWWRAPAWAGKSALMAWFVLHPPPGIKLVSFFITARLGDYDRRTAFVDVVMEQLLDMLDEPIPPFLTDATRESHLLALFARAARRCEDDGERLILVIDGLDEDRGVVAGPDARSIAGLLPDKPPSGMRIIVTGRPNPPIPSDVDERHPLREANTIQRLSQSAHAAVVRTDMLRELKYLLRGTQEERDLVGLLTAAVGGLSAEDLAALTNWSAWDVTVEEHLQTVAGRSLGVRGNRWRRDTDVYLLGHEELQAEARRVLGPERLAAYERRLCAWADEYRRRSWPDDTPEYLLRGYYGMLANAGYLDEMVNCATDSERHDRMLDLSGGDSAALGEINIAMDSVLKRDCDLTSMVKLAMHRDYLGDRNSNLPVKLPAVWVELDVPARAEALARSVSDPVRRAQVLVAVVRALAATGELGRAMDIAQAIIDDGSRAEALTTLSKTAAAVLDFQYADEILKSINFRSWRTWGYASLAVVQARVGEVDQARLTIKAVKSGLSYVKQHSFRLAIRTTLIEAVSAVGDTDQALLLADQVEREAALSSTGIRDNALMRLSRTVFDIGEHDRALLLSAGITSHSRRLLAKLSLAVKLVDLDVKRARQIILGVNAEIPRISNLVKQVEVISDLARASVEIGEATEARKQVVEAERVARSISKPDDRARAFVALARARYICGDVAQARSLAAEAENTARSITRPGREIDITVCIAESLAVAREYMAAEEILRTLREDHPRGWAKGVIAILPSLVGSSQKGQAQRLIDSVVESHLKDTAILTLVRAFLRVGNIAEAEIWIQRIVHAGHRSAAVTALIQGLAEVGKLGAAENLANSIEDRHWRRRSLTAIVEAAVAAGQTDVTRRLSAVALRLAEGEGAVEAVTVAAAANDLTGIEGRLGAVVDADELSKAKVVYVRALAKSGHLQRAAEVAATITSANQRVSGLIAVIGESRRGGQRGRIPKMAKSAQNIISTFNSRDQRDRALKSLVEALASAGNTSRARNVVERIQQPEMRAQAQMHLAEFGPAEIARKRLGTAFQVGPWMIPMSALARISPGSLKVVVEESVQLGWIRSTVKLEGDE